MDKLQRIVKQMLKRREERDTYLTHVCWHHSSGGSAEKRWNTRSFQATLWLSSALDVYVYSDSWSKLHSLLKEPYISSFHWTLSAPVMSIDVSQVRVALSLLFNILYYFTFPGFPFILIQERTMWPTTEKGLKTAKVCQ